MTGTKRKKDHITMALCCDAMGSVKIQRLIISKVKQLRYDLEVLVMQCWMLSTILEEWLHDFDHQMAQEKCQVVLLFDNTPIHVAKSVLTWASDPEVPPGQHHEPYSAPLSRNNQSLQSSLLTSGGLGLHQMHGEGTLIRELCQHGIQSCSHHDYFVIAQV